MDGVLSVIAMLGSLVAIGWLLGSSAKPSTRARPADAPSPEHSWPESAIERAGAMDAQTSKGDIAGPGARRQEEGNPMTGRPGAREG